MVETIQGIDVSGYQGVLDQPDLVTHGIGLEFIKATEGNGYVNPTYHANSISADAHGVLRVPYHFLSHDLPAAAQAEHFLRIIDRPHNKGMLLPALDVEPDPSSRMAIRNARGQALGTRWPASYLVKQVDDFQTFVKGGVNGVPGLGVYITIYTYGSWWTEYMGDTHNYGKVVPLWWAKYWNSYQPTPLPPDTPPFGGWQYWTFWQWSDRGQVGSLYTDRDLFKGPIEDLKKFANY